MSMPFYVSPDQLVKDRAEFARKGIARGRSVIVARYDRGIVFIAENLSSGLHKISEIYDRIGFAAVGRYHEFESLRVAGIRWADVRGYSYDRADVTGRGLANSYAQLLGAAFSAGVEKPYEVELVVAELGDSPHQDCLYRISFDGSVADEPGIAVMGGHAEQLHEYLVHDYDPSADLASVLKLGVSGLRSPSDATDLGPGSLEVGVLDRNRSGVRKFTRLTTAQVADVLGEES